MIRQTPHRRAAPAQGSPFRTASRFAELRTCRVRFQLSLELARRVRHLCPLIGHVPILDDFGRVGSAWRKTDVEDTDLETPCQRIKVASDDAAADLWLGLLPLPGPLHTLVVTGPGLAFLCATRWRAKEVLTDLEP